MRSLIVVAIAVASSAGASPPPPPPAFVDEVAQQLLPALTAANFDDYAALLADDLTVTVDGKVIAANKKRWLALERPLVGKVDRFVYGYAEGRDNVLILDRFDDRSDEHCLVGHTCIFDPRYHARAVRYEIGGDHLIHAIRIIQSDGNLRTP